MNQRNWLRISLYNLLIVALIGCILRYKITYSLPFIDQKKLLHGHSHFAFSGWITQALMAIIVSRLSHNSSVICFKRYNPLLWLNLICAYGMVISFPVLGYNPVSIFFSTTSLIVSFIFMYMIWKDINSSQDKLHIHKWIKAATLFQSVSSFGAFALAYMMSTKNMHQNWYLASVYFFLHFQYNGWFSFTILGLLFDKLEQIKIDKSILNKLFYSFLIACAPAYFLSALWMKLPLFIYIIVVISALLQVFAWARTVQLIRKNTERLKQIFSPLPFRILSLSLIALSIKFFLQLGSTIPNLENLAFGFRPIVIGYLHLVLLGVVSLFILSYGLHCDAFRLNSISRKGFIIFIGGIILNEMALMIQGFAAMGYLAIPYINETLFVIAVTMFSGVLLINWGQQSGKSDVSLQQ